MITSVYPFWSSIATQVGRLLKLQGSAVATQIQRRAREQYGERETVSRRARYILRSYVDWNVIRETETKGVYFAGSPIVINDTKMVAWLIEASLAAREKPSAPLKELVIPRPFSHFVLNQHLLRIL